MAIWDNHQRLLAVGSVVRFFLLLSVLTFGLMTGFAEAA
jgi:hypothetical protein